MRYKVRVKRVAEYIATIVVDAPDEIEAEVKIINTLSSQGWEAVFGDDDGEFINGEYQVLNAIPMGEPDDEV